MKNIVVFSLLFTILLGLSSCGEDFLVAENKNQLVVEDWYKTAEDFNLALNSCYGPIMGYYSFRNMWLFGSFEEWLLFERPPIDKFQIQPGGENAGNVNTLYRDMYMGLYRTNRVILELHRNDDIKDLGSEERFYIEAQARALRAMYYFKLVTFWDRPPFYDEETYPWEPSQNVTNGEQIDFWEKIEVDLDFAIPYLLDKSEVPSDQIGRVHKNAARALLGKALLYKHYYYYSRFDMKGTPEDIADLEKARDAFKAVMNSGENELIQPKDPKSYNDYLYALSCNFSHIDLSTGTNTYDSENNLESVWEVQFSDVYTQNLFLPGWFCTSALMAQYFSPLTPSWKNLEVHPELVFSFENTEAGTAPASAGYSKDPRLYASVYFDGDPFHVNPSINSTKFASVVHTLNMAKNRNDVTSPAGGAFGYGLRKYHFPVWDGAQVAASGNNWRVIRYSDVLLMYAETMYHLGDDGTGLNALNEVRARVDMPERTELTVENIKKERDFELCLESLHFFDLVRWNWDSDWAVPWDEIFVPDRFGSVIFITGKNEFLPIPQSEIDVNNGELRQNPGW